MADAKTNHAESLILQWLLTNSTVARPTSWYVALHTADPGEDAATAELSAGGYSRQAVSFTVTGDTAENDADITFGPAPSSWGTLTHFSIWDADTGGNALYKGALQSPKNIEASDSLVFAAGDLDITEA